MPHDKNGHKLKVGDEVVLRRKITHLTAGEEYCNVTLEVAPMHPRTSPESMSAINTRQLELVCPVLRPADDLEPPPSGPDGGPV